MKIDKPIEQEKVLKKINQFQNKVLKRYPNARMEWDQLDDGSDRLVVKVGNMILQDEFFLPNTTDDFFSWYYAALSVKTTQQFNRTHPMKLQMNFGDKEEKKKRINKRRKSGKRTTQINQDK